MPNIYPRESVEHLPVVVKRDGVQITSGLTFAIVPDGTRPVTFLASVEVDGKPGVMVSGLGPGTYRVYAKMTQSPEIPVVDCGHFYVD